MKELNVKRKPMKEVVELLEQNIYFKMEYYNTYEFIGYDRCKWQECSDDGYCSICNGFIRYLNIESGDLRSDCLVDQGKSIIDTIILQEFLNDEDLMI